MIIPGLRSIRVLFGDGRGDFRRMTMTRIFKQHDLIGFPAGVPFDFDHVLQPRDIAVGNFTQSDRMQIAGGLVEGDIVVFSYDHGTLNEVARTRTEFWLPGVRAGNFGRSGETDLYVMGTAIWGGMYPRPRVFFGGSAGVTIMDGSSRQPARRRALRPGKSELVFQAQISGECLHFVSERWVFEGPGIFGVAETDGGRVETVFDGPSIYFRLQATFTPYPVFGVLTESGGMYSGTASVMTPCGWKTMTVTATRE